MKNENLLTLQDGVFTHFQHLLNLYLQFDNRFLFSYWLSSFKSKIEKLKLIVACLFFFQEKLLKIARSKKCVHWYN